MKNKILILLTWIFTIVSISSSQAIFDAVKNNDIKSVRSLLSKSSFLKDEIDTNGQRPIHYSNDTGITKAFLESGVNIDARDNLGYTPLHVATKNNNLKIIKMLLENGADIDARTDSGDTPLHIAAKNGKKDIITFLLNNKSNPPNLYVKNNDKDGKTPADVAKNQNIKDQIINFEKRLDYKLDFKIKELKSLNEKLEKKKTLIKQAIESFDNDIKDLKEEIKNERKLSRISSFTEAKNNRFILSNLTLIQQKISYIETLKKEDSLTINKIIEIRYLSKKTQDELRLYKTLGDREATQLISEIDRIILENDYRAMEKFDTNSMTYNSRLNIIPTESIEEIYKSIK